MTETAPSSERLFTEHRSLLFTIAYEMLGSAADAEDVVQETWLRWAGAAQDEVSDPRAYLARIVTRQSLNRLRTLKRQRETYVGPWLPEPLLTAPDVADDVELAESVSFAMLVVLETLTPLERAVFVLREVFGFDYDEIAAATDRSAAAVRQLASRAKKHVQARRPRFDPDPNIEEITVRFFAAVTGGDLQGLMDLMAPDVVMLTDGGGKVKAALRPIVGGSNVARFLIGVAPMDREVTASFHPINGSTGVLTFIDGALDLVASLRVVDGLVAALFLVRNPDKLTGTGERRIITRH